MGAIATALAKIHGCDCGGSYGARDRDVFADSKNFVKEVLVLASEPTNAAAWNIGEVATVWC
jgi:hypothetical protein